jgi:hypothetical protein
MNNENRNGKIAALCLIALGVVQLIPTIPPMVEFIAQTYQTTIGGKAK